ncbi:MAG: PIN domain-containing protein [Deltaproteobacteria bacterium]|nr:PIN domain-containing protein [Deltaproteobacteria bacterium]
MMVLVDTTIWSLALRRRRGAINESETVLVKELERLIREGHALLIGLVRQEILSGIRVRRQFDQLKAHLRAFKDEDVLLEDYEAAAELSNTCREAGITGSTVDYLICAVALRRSVPIFTTDPDFRHYARKIPLELHTPGTANS